MLDFYFSPGSCALASHILLEELGADYRGHRVDFGQEQQKGADYLKINPKGRVPALVTDQGILTETPAILVYLAEIHGRGDLVLRDDPFAFARLQAFNSYAASTLHVNHAHRGRGQRWAAEESAWEAMRRHVPVSVAAGYAYVEEEALVGPYVMGDVYTVADPYLYTISRWLEGDSVDVARFPKVKAHMEMMVERPATLRALEAEGLAP